MNGLGHFDALQQRFGAERVLGGLCMISAALDAAGTVQHFNDFHALVFGELDGSSSPRVAEMLADFAGAKFEARASSQMLLELWEKWVFIAAAAAITCLMRASIGDIVAAGAVDLSERLLEECRAIAAANGFAPRPAAIERYRADPDRRRLADLGVDAEGHRARRAGRGRPRHRRPAAPRPRRRRCPPPSLLRIAHAHLKAYEARRASSV